MSPSNWTRFEVEAVVTDYLAMLASELAGTSYSKAKHRRALLQKLTKRTEQSIEYKHANISAILLEAGFPYIDGYKPHSNYQGLLREVVLDRLNASPQLLEIAAANADQPIVVPEVQNILAVLVQRKPSAPPPNEARELEPPVGIRLTTNYVEREARNRSLGTAGELFVLAYERARLLAAGLDILAAKIEHTSQVRGDHEGYDVLSFEESGAGRLIEVKTTKHGSETPFYVTRNEVATSARNAPRYQVYRLFSFKVQPRLYTLPGAIDQSCLLSATTFLAQPR